MKMIGKEGKKEREKNKMRKRKERERQDKHCSVHLSLYQLLAAFDTTFRSTFSRFQKQSLNNMSIFWCSI
jgi:hypothetical protein